MRIKCLKTEKSIYCRVRGPGTEKGKGAYFQKFQPEIVRDSIFMDTYYKRKFGIKNMGRLTKFKIYKPKFYNKFWYIFRTCLDHPNDGVKMGSWLGFISLLLGLISIILGILAFVKTK